MDEISRGIATAALALQTVILQVLLAKGVFSSDEAVDIVDQCLAAAGTDPNVEEAGQVAEVACSCLEEVREGPAEMGVRH